jgi:vancomycin permeability regulator SanA
MFPEKRVKANLKLFLVLVYLMIIPLILLFFINLFGITIPHGYIFGFQQKKIFYGVLFLASLSLQLYLIQMIWGYFLGTKSFIFAHSFVMVAVYIISAILIAFLSSIIFTSGGNSNNSNKKYDVAVVLGAAVWSNNEPSPIFEARIEKAKELYIQGRVDKIQLTGSNAPGEISEAGAAFNLLRNFGIDKDFLIIEEKTSTTSEQIKFIKDNLINKNEHKKVVIISDAFHLIRIKEMCKFYGVEADVIASEYQLNWGIYLFYIFRDSISLLLFWIFAI